MNKELLGFVKFTAEEEIKILDKLEELEKRIAEAEYQIQLLKRKED